MHRTLIVLVVGLLAVGCGGSKYSRSLTLEEKKVVGEYEYNDRRGVSKAVLLNNGVYEEHENGKKTRENKWSIINGEIHAGSEFINVYRIDKDKSITYIALIEYGKRKECTHYANQMGNQFIKKYTKIQ